MRILYDNIIKDATITASSEHPDFTFAVGLLDKRLSRVSRTIDDDDQWIKFTMSSATNASYICIKNHNFTSGATVKIEGNATDSWGAPTFTQTITVSDDMCAAFASTQNFQYWRLTVDDASNPDTYIEIGYVFLGVHLAMPGYDAAVTTGEKSTAETEYSASGQLYGDKRIVFKTAEITFPDVSQANKDLISAFFAEMDKTEPFVLLIAEDTPLIYPSLYCSLTTDLSWAKAPNQGLSYSLKLSFQECK